MLGDLNIGRLCTDKHLYCGEIKDFDFLKFRLFKIYGFITDLYLVETDLVRSWAKSVIALKVKEDKNTESSVIWHNYAERSVNQDHPEGKLLHLN